MNIRFYVRVFDKGTKKGEWVPSQKTWPSIRKWADEVGDFLLEQKTSFYIEDEDTAVEELKENPF